MFDKIRKTLASFIDPEKKSIPRAGQLPAYTAGKPYFHFNAQTASTALEKIKKSAWTMACMRAYGDALQVVEIVAQEQDPETGAWERYSGHPIEVTFNSPNPYQTKADLLQVGHQGLVMTGNACSSLIHSDRPDEDGIPRTLRIEALDTDYVYPVADPLDMFAGYRVTKANPAGWFGFDSSGAGFGVGGNSGEWVDPGDMVHVRIPNIKDPLWGLSPLVAAAVSMDSESAAITWNNAILSNRPETGGVLETEQAMTKEQVDEAKEIMAAQFTGAKAGTPMILTRGLKWKQTHRSPVDMDFLDLDKRTGEKVCAVLRVPPPIVGMPESSYAASLPEYRKIFWLDGVIPFLRILLGGYNHGWVWPRYGRNFRIWYDVSQVEALSENRGDKVRDFQAMVQYGYTPNELNRWLDLGLPESPVGNIRFFGSSLMPIGGDTRAIAGQNDPEVIEGEIVEDGPKALTAGGESAKVAFWKSFEQARAQHYERTHNTVTDLIAADVRALADVADASDAAIDAVFEKRRGEWEDSLFGIWSTVGRDFGRRTYDDLGKRAGVPELKNTAVDWNEAIRRYVRERVGEKVTGIFATTKAWLKVQVRVALEEGTTFDSLSSAIRSLGPEYSKRRAYTISRTEVIGASNYGSQVAASVSGVTQTKTWVSSRDSRVRSKHQTMDGERRPINQPYSNGLMFPGDPQGSASQVIQCRCVEMYEVT